MNSYRRIGKVLSSIMIDKEVRGVSLNKCPFCGGTVNDNQCKICKTEWLVTDCPHEDCKHQFVFSSLLSSQHNKVLDLIHENHGITLENIEGFLSFNNLTDLCPSQEEGFKSPICPKCGRCPRHGKNKDCFMCSG